MGNRFNDDEEKDHPLTPPRVLGDFGGRRRTFERRLKKKSIDHKNRRSEKDRRSGFDRRGVVPENQDTCQSQNRKSDKQNDLSDD